MLESSYLKLDTAEICRVYLTKKEAWTVYYTGCDKTGILEHDGNVENTSRRRVFSTLLEFSQMSRRVGPV